METFYNGLLPPTRLMLDASAGGALLNKSYAEAYDLIESIAAIAISGLPLESIQRRKWLGYMSWGMYQP